MRSLLLVLCLPALVPASSYAVPQFFGSVGKYNDCDLSLQWDCWYNGVGQSACDGCMRSTFPATGFLNPFDDGDGTNCNGTYFTDPLNIYFRWYSEPCWTSYWVFTTPGVMQNTIDLCNQNHPSNPAAGGVGDVNCAYFPNNQPPWVEVEGAYILAAEIDLGSLKDEIDMNTLGYPPIGTHNPYTQWQEYIPYIILATSDWYVDAYMHPAKKVYLASWMYYTDALNQGVPATPDEKDKYEVALETGMDRPKASLPANHVLLDVAFARKCAAHALICWQMDDGGGTWDWFQGWGDGSTEIDLGLPALGWPTFPWYDFNQNPQFLYWFDFANRPYVGGGFTDVKHESWGSIKSRYR